MVSKNQVLMTQNCFTTKSLTLIVGMLYDRLSHQVVLYTDNLAQRLSKFKEYCIAAILPLDELQSLDPRHLFTLLKVTSLPSSESFEVKRRLLAEMITPNAPMPKDLLKFINKVLGLC